MSKSKKRILIIDHDPVEAENIENILNKSGYLAYRVEDSQKALDSIYNEPPDLIIADIDMRPGGNVFCQRLKGDTTYSQLPIILLIPPGLSGNRIDWDSTPADDYITKPINPDELIFRISFSISRSERELDANPLTRLPGNNPITKEIQKRIDSSKKFALAYIDLDNFKAYNDKYGFIRGDEALRVTARIVTNAVRELNQPGTFAGHIGGDDFVFIVPLKYADEVCQRIIKHFDAIITSFYDEEDRLKGYIDSADRTGKKRKIPVMTVSIAVVTNEKRKISHIGEASTIAADLKKYCKSLKGSNYVTDRRGKGKP